MEQELDNIKKADNIKKGIEDLIKFENYIKKHHHMIWYNAREKLGFLNLKEE